MMSQIKQLETLQVDSILDMGFAKFEQQERFRQFASDHFFEYQIHYLNVDSTVRRKGFIERNIKKVRPFNLTLRKPISILWTWLENPKEDELDNPVVIK
ncbi:hypothetical protein [Ascidiimonas aurantiaca]|uniref:hypothetical protein n=1 Tax=Ascidiimonas aurantiaca TaxID=1685432 RepID=UPI0030EF5314